jgi:hypothetical protein
MLLCAAGFVVAQQAAATAADFTVNSNGDGVDAAPNGQCATAGGLCTLRAAVMEAESLASPGKDVISVPAMTITLGTPLQVTKTVQIKGAGARGTIITGTPGHGMFTIGGGDVDLQDLAIQGGRTTAGGAGLAIYQTANAATTLTRVRVVDNRVTGVPAAYGPLYLSAGEITITDSEISGNSAASTLTNAYGGALYLSNTGTRATIVNSTIHSNSATSASNSYGGAIMTFAGTTVVIRSSTIANNVTANTASISATGGNFYAQGSVAIENSIVSGGVAGSPSWANCYSPVAGAFTFSGRNIVSDATCGADSATRTIADPQLGALADNGGQTNSVLPASTSPAVDAVVSCAPGTDQRGQVRPIGAACDIGSTEIGADVTVSQTVSNPNPGAGSDVVFTVNATNAGLDDVPGYEEHPCEKSR